MKIRTAMNRDSDDIQRVHLSAFPEGEGEIIAKLAIDILFEKTTPHTLSLVAETEGAVNGHVAFSPVIIENNERVQGYILSPLGVTIDYQKRRIGSKLIENGMQQLSIMKVNVIFVYGDPVYYNRFGFSTEVARQYTAPYKLQYPFGWQAVMLHEYAIEKAPAAITCITSLSDPELW